MVSVLPVRRFRIHRAAAFLGAIVARYARRLILWRTRQALLALNDHMLRDIGLTRQDIELGRFPSCED
ncbi:MAG: DUF1127 domain-containing protein [Aestuariivirgaceae bacterium]